MEDRRLGIPLNPLRAFAVASRHKTFTAAAAELGVTQVAISRQITTLENYLNVSLFERGTRSAKLTDVGRAFGSEIAGLFDDIERATNRLIAHETESTINLRVHPTFAQLWMIPRLPDFFQKYPGVRVRFDTRIEPLDFRGTHLHLAVQLGSGNWRDARCRKLFDEEVDVVCSAAYLQQSGGISTPKDVAGAELLHSRYRRRAWEYWSRSVGIDLHHQQGIEFDTSLLTYAAAENGFGLAVGQLGLLDNIIEAGRLVRPLNMRVPTKSAFYAVWPTMVSVNVNTKRFVDWMLLQVGESPEFFRAQTVKAE